MPDAHDAVTPKVERLARLLEDEGVDHAAALAYAGAIAARAHSATAPASRTGEDEHDAHDADRHEAAPSRSISTNARSLGGWRLAGLPAEPGGETIMPEHRPEHRSDWTYLVGVTLYTHLGPQTQAGDAEDVPVGSVGADLVDGEVSAVILAGNGMPRAEFVAWLRSVADQVEGGDLPGPGDGPTLLRSSHLE